MISCNLLISREMVIRSSLTLTGIKPAIALVGANMSASGSKKKQRVNVGVSELSTRRQYNV
mgnify:CR=1 FL=1